MLMDKTKIDRVLPFTFCKLEDVDVLITDAPLPEEIVSAIDTDRTKIVYASDVL